MLATGWAVRAGFGRSVSKATGQMVTPIMSAIMTAKIAMACFIRFSMRPNIRTSEKGKISIARLLKKFDRPVGFSNGCAEFMP